MHPPARRMAPRSRALVWRRRIAALVVLLALVVAGLIVLLRPGGHERVVPGGGDGQGEAGLGKRRAGPALDRPHTRAVPARGGQLRDRSGAAGAGGDARRVRRLERARRHADERFDPARSLEATGRYLALAER